MKGTVGRREARLMSSLHDSTQSRPIVYLLIAMSPLRVASSATPRAGAGGPTPSKASQRTEINQVFEEISWVKVSRDPALLQDASDLL